MGGRVRFVGTKVDLLVSVSWITVQIEFGLIGNNVNTIDAKAIRLKPPVTAIARVPGNDV